MKYRRVVGNIAALATLAGGSAFVAMAAPANAGSVADGDFPTVGKETVDVVRGSDGDASGIVPKESIEDTSGSSDPKEAAQSHVKRLAPALGVDPNGLEAVKSNEVADGNVVRFEQKVDGLEVYGGEYVAALGQSNELNALLGEGVTEKVEKVGAKIDEAQAVKTAIEHIAEKQEVSAASLQADVEAEQVFDPSIFKGDAPSAPRKVLNVHVYNQAGDIDSDVLINAGIGNVALDVSNVKGSLERMVCDAEGEDYGQSTEAICGENVEVTRSEGDDPTGNEQVDNMYDHLGNTAKWYASNADIDLTELIGNADQQGGKALRASVNICFSEAQPECPMENAFYQSATQQVYFGESFNVLDIVGHEVTHGVNDQTNGLKYIYQSGAIDESIADVMGELIDLSTNPDKIETDAAGMHGEDREDGANRSLKDPTQFEDPDTMTSEYWDEDPQGADAGGVHTNSGVGNKAAWLIGSGGDFNGYQIQGIGLAKTFKLYWSVQNLLTPGADYKDLSNTLQVACDKNIGREGTFFTEQDCAQVDKAVRATEMHEDASNQAPSPAYCENGGNVNRTYFEGFDSKKDLTFEGDDQNVGLAWKDFQFKYHNSGEDAAMAWTGDSAGGTSYDEAVGTQTSSVTVPENGLLRVDYATEFGPGVTAGIEINAGDGWVSGAEFDGSVNAEPWTGMSGGWGGARYDLSELAGEDIQIRFKVDGASPQEPSILYVDNLKLYNCS